MPTRYLPTHHSNLNHIPGDWGLPLVGSALPLVSDLLNTARQRVARYGVISRVRLGPERGLLVVGSDSYRSIFTDNQQRFSARLGYMNQLGRFYEGGLLLRDADDHRAQRRILQQAFKFTTMRDYVPRVEHTVLNHLATWSRGDAFHFYDHIKRTLLDVATDIFLGIPDEDQRGEFVSRAFLDIASGLGSLLPWDLPGTPIRRGLQGRDRLHQYLHASIEDKRQQLGMDMLSLLANARTDDGKTFCNKEVIQHVAFLLFAAHDTTTSLLSHSVMYLGLYPDFQSRLRVEYDSLKKATLEWDDLSALPLTQHFLDEVLRLHPPVPLMVRRTTVEVELGGYTIPAHTDLFMPSAYNQRDGRYWLNPDDFDPERFSAERSEHKQHGFYFHPFGGGAHKCIGMHFAYMIAKLCLFHLLRNSVLELPDNFQPKLAWIPIPRPANGPPIILRDHPKR